MAECKFCGEEFDSEQELHLHLEEHEEELNSHQKEKLKKAKRKKKEKKKARNAKRKKTAGVALAGGGLLLIAAVLGMQLMNNVGQQQEIDLEGEPMLGNPNASVTVVEFGDYRCPICKQFEQQVFPQLNEQFISNDRINFYFVNYAFLDSGFPGQTSTRAAIAGECVLNQDQEQFWNYHHHLYDIQGAESTDWATEQVLLNAFNESTEGLDYNEFEQCLVNQETRSEVQQDRQMARNLGVSGTPTVFVNGKKVSNWGFNSLKVVIQQELN